MPKDLPMTDNLSIQITDGKPVEIPTADVLIDATFIKDGADLVLHPEGGTPITIEGYFGTLDAPDIISADGARLTPDMVEAFAQSVHDGQYANNASSLSDVSAIGQISEMIGHVMVTRADGSEIMAEPGLVIHQVDVIETSGDGAANIVFADNTSFAISEDAKLSVDEFVYNSSEQEGSSFFSMLKGAFVYTSGIIGKDDPGNVNIETPAGSIGIRGTVVAGKIDPTGQNTEITILDGAIIITNGAGTVELDSSLETVRLAGFNTEPEFIGQITPEQAQSNFQSLSSVSNSTFQQAFGDGTQSNQNAQTTQQQADNDSEADILPDATVEDAPKVDTQADIQSESQDSETLDVPDNLNDSNTQSEGPLGDESALDRGERLALREAIRERVIERRGDADGVDTTDPMLDPNNDTTPPPSPSLTGFQLEIFGPGGTNTIQEFTEEGAIGRIIAPPGAINAGLNFDIVNVTGTNPTTTTTTDLTNTFTIDAQGFIILNETLVLNTSIHENLNFEIEITGPGGGSSLRQSFDIDIEPIADATFNRIVGTIGNVDDTLTATTVNSDIVAGGAGNDIIDDASDGNDILLGGSGNDTINDDSNGDDILNGGLGDDMFSISSISTGADTIRGGAGNDTIEIFNVDTQDIIEGGAGFDTLKLVNDAASGTANNTFDLTTANNITGIERITLEDPTIPVPDQVIELDNATISQLTSDHNVLIFDREGTGLPLTVNLEGDWQIVNNPGLSPGLASISEFDTGDVVFQNAQIPSQFIINSAGGAISFQEDDGAGGSMAISGSVNGSAITIPDLAPAL